MSEEQKLESSSAAEAKGPTFAIQRIYIKDLSFEVPNAPKIFLDNWQPNISLELNSEAHKLEDSHTEIVLVVTVTVKTNDKIAFLAEVQQAGIFKLEGFSDEQMRRMIGVFCPNIIFPFLRETINDVVVRGGFPPLYLSPINFEAIYEQRQKQEQEQQSQPQANVGEEGNA